MRGPLRGEAEAVAAVLPEQRRPEAERDGEPRGRQADGLAGVGGRRGRACSRAARRAARPSCGVRRRSRRCSSVAQVLAARALDDVERGEVQAVLRGRDDAGLVRAVERRPARC